MELITPDKTIEKYEDSIYWNKSRLKGIPPTLQVILSNNPNSDELSYLKSINTTAKRLQANVNIRYIDIENDSSENVNYINHLFCAEDRDGTIIISKNICEQERYLNPLKDLDCVFTHHTQSYWSAPCTPAGCLQLLKDTCGDLTGRSIAVLGRSKTIGSHIVRLCCDADAKVTILHSKCDYDLSDYEIIVSAIGQPEMIGLHNFSREPDGQYLIDVGMNVNSKGKLCGDFKFEDFKDTNVHITPVPGCVGKISTIALFDRLFWVKCFKEKGTVK